MFCFVYKSEEDVVDLFPDERSQPQKLAVDAMQNRLQEVALSGVFAIKKLQEL